MRPHCTLNNPPQAYCYHEPCSALPSWDLTPSPTRRAQLEPFLRTCGFRESSIQWLPAVGPSGENLAKPASDPRLAAWWKGPTLAQASAGVSSVSDIALAATSRLHRATGGPLPRVAGLANFHAWPLLTWASLAQLQAIDNFRPTHRLLEKPLRMPLTDVLRRWAQHRVQPGCSGGPGASLT